MNPVEKKARIEKLWVRVRMNLKMRGAFQQQGVDEKDIDVLYSNVAEHVTCLLYTSDAADE